MPHVDPTYKAFLFREGGVGLVYWHRGPWWAETVSNKAGDLSQE